jgi:hypothetical protein
MPSLPPLLFDFLSKRVSYFVDRLCGWATRRNAPRNINDNLPNLFIRKTEVLRRLKVALNRSRASGSAISCSFR